MILFVVALGVPTNSFADLEDGLLAHWTFDEGSGTILYDVFGDHDGTIYGDPEWESGVAGYCLRFDGVNDYVEIPDVSDFVFVNQSVTYSAWVQIYDNEDVYRCFISLGDSPPAPNPYPTISLYKHRGLPHHGKIQMAVVTDFAHYPAQSNDDGETLPKYEWIFLAGVVDHGSSLVKLYVNGVLQDSVATLGDFDLGAAEYLKLRLGHGAYGHANTIHKGLLDEVRIYDRALSDEEICDLYNIIGPWDQEKLFDDPLEGYILHYTDDDLDGYHDPGEPYFAGPDPSANDWNVDNSCWIASACNMLRHRCLGNPYLDWLGAGAAPSPSTSPWGNEFHAGGGGDAMTFDDCGWQQWALAHAGYLFAGPIITESEFGAGTWSINPIDWCQARLSSGHPVGLTVWWGSPPRGTLPGRVDLTKLDGYHAITLWGIDEDAGTLTITDSDDRFLGSRVVSYTYVGNDWVIQNLYPGVNAHVNYAVGYRPQGDVTGDGVIELGDVVYLINFLYREGPAPDPLCAGDANCDGIVDLGDVVYLINYIYRGGPPPGC